MNAAREKVGVANALGDLPRISESFSRGEISYSKVRAMNQDDQDVSAETSESPAKSETPDREPIDRRRVDALANIAESYLAKGPTASSTGDRYQVLLHVSAETLTLKKH